MELLILVTSFGGVIWYFVHKAGEYKRHYPLTLDSYLKENPECKTDNGMKCSGCGSKSLRNMGIHHATSAKRVISCNSCGKRLYRVEN